MPRQEAGSRVAGCGSLRDARGPCLRAEDAARGRPRVASCGTEEAPTPLRAKPPARPCRLAGLLRPRAPWGFREQHDRSRRVGGFRVCGPRTPNHGGDNGGHGAWGQRTWGTRGFEGNGRWRFPRDTPSPRQGGPIACGDRARNAAPRDLLCASCVKIRFSHESRCKCVGSPRPQPGSPAHHAQPRCWRPASAWLPVTGGERRGRT